MEIKQLYIFFLFTAISCSSCQSQNDSKKQEIFVNKINDLKTEFNLANGDYVLVESDKSMSKSWLTINGEKRFDLPFVYAGIYRGLVFELTLPPFGSFLAIESSIPGASGIASNITNVSLLPYRDTELDQPLSFNSFFSGAKSISINKDAELRLSILELGLHGQEDRFYCETIFRLNAVGIFEPVNIGRCIQESDGGLENGHDCNCQMLNEPFVDGGYK